MTKEAKLLGTLLPSHPDFQPIIEAVREKYGLPEISLDSDPIEEIYLGEKNITFQEFRQEIGDMLRADLRFFPPETIKQYKSAKAFSTFQSPQELDILSRDIKAGIEILIKLTANISTPILQGLEDFIDRVADMLYEYILTGEAGEVPPEWFSRVVTSKANDETAIFIMASQVSDPEEIVKQFRYEYRKNFGTYRPKITKKNISAGYYMQLKRLGKPWNFIVEEYIRLENISMPRDASSKRYVDRIRILQQTIKKRIQRSEKVLEVIMRDNK